MGKKSHFFGGKYEVCIWSRQYEVQVFMILWIPKKIISLFSHILTWMEDFAKHAIGCWIFSFSKLRNCSNLSFVQIPFKPFLCLHVWLFIPIWIFFQSYGVRYKPVDILCENLWLLVQKHTNCFCSLLYFESSKLFRSNSHRIPSF